MKHPVYHGKYKLGNIIVIVETNQTFNGEEGLAGICVYRKLGCYTQYGRAMTNFLHYTHFNAVNFIGMATEEELKTPKQLQRELDEQKRKEVLDKKNKIKWCNLLVR